MPPDLATWTPEAWTAWQIRAWSQAWEAWMAWCRLYGVNGPSLPWLSVVAQGPADDAAATVPGVAGEEPRAKAIASRREESAVTRAAPRRTRS